MVSLILAMHLVAGNVLGAEARGLHWEVPRDWTEEGPRPVRLATYAVPRAPGDEDETECAVFGFERGGGGAVEDTIDLWFSLFDSSEPTVPFQLDLGVVRVTLVEVQGTIRTNLRAGKAIRPAFILLGAIVDGPRGRMFFKLVGPRRSVEAARAAFGRMVRGVRA
jgi:hypothetical protein